FRPEYRELKRLRELFPGVPLAAFTATATSRVRADIVAQLGLEGAASFRGSFNRSNLIYEVRPKKEAYAQLVSFLGSRPHTSGIIYCGSRAGTEDLARRLRIDGFRAVAYHAGLEAEERRRHQEAFSRDDIPIMVATIAFGMGIDKPDVRFVVHFDLPRTLENYYQESGRAGRDGEPSDCILFYSRGDLIKLRRFADEKASQAERQVALWQLQRMADWAESGSCRRRELLAYFDEPFDGQDPPCCDVCRTPSAEEDATVPAQMFLSCVKRTGERFGAGHVIDVLRGSRNQRVQTLGHDRLSTYGIGRDRSDDDWRNLVRELIRGGFLHQDPDRFNALRVTERGRAVLFEGERVTVVVRRKPPQEVDAGAGQVHQALFDRLRSLRKTLADDQGVPPYVIFHDRTLLQIASELPTSPDHLRRIHGVGERKALEYGEIFLAAVAAYMEETGAVPSSAPPSPAPRRRTPGELGDTVRETLRLFRDGLDIGEIARMRGLTPATIEGHLADAIEAGEGVEIDRVIDTEKRRTIEAAMEALGSDYLKPVLERLGEGYTYGDLRLVRAIRRTSV
ncbi:MAG: RecQ family ATP-dependent DNA helicase, partial [Chloroflexi bacterium]|nr:RecQ family ATP-dependent DNA helicase [Chloroflexota bacterium]